MFLIDGIDCQSLANIHRGEWNIDFPPWFCNRFWFRVQFHLGGVFIIRRVHGLLVLYFAQVIRHQTWTKPGNHQILFYSSFWTTESVVLWHSVRHWCPWIRVNDHSKVGILTPFSTALDSPQNLHTHLECFHEEKSRRLGRVNVFFAWKRTDSLVCFAYFLKEIVLF